MWNNFLTEIVKYLPSVDVKWNSPSTFAKQIFHSGAISHGEAIFHSPKANFVEKKHLLSQVLFFWWERVDSDHRSQWQQIYSLPPLAAREIPQMELVIGVEPTTCWLQISCSAIEPHQLISFFAFQRRGYYITKCPLCQHLFSLFLNYFSVFLES